MTRSRDVADTQDNLGGAVAPYVAGKNKIINGAMDIWQRGTSIALGNGLVRGADRWYTNSDSGLSGTTSRQAFTAGAAPSSGYEFAYFMRQNITGVSGGSFIVIAGQDIEDVRTFAGQTITVSFWAKADTTRTYGVSYQQQFGTGGSSPVYGPSVNVTLSTSWARYSVNINVPSLAGKTVGTSSYLLFYILASTVSTQTLDIAGIQAEAGNVATPFQTASGSIGGELALCQRYFNRLVDGTIQAVGTLQAISTTAALGTRSFPEMRIGPTVIYTTIGEFSLRGATNTVLAATGSSSFNIARQAVTVYFTVASGLVAGNATEAFSTGANARLDLSAEL